MSDGQWRTARAIAGELDASLTTVQGVMWSIKEAWGYEAVPSRNKGYRRMNNHDCIIYCENQFNSAVD